MASFTGPEIAALISEKCVIAATEAFSTELRGQMERMPFFQQRMTGYVHWVNGVFLITSVEEESGMEIVPISSQASLDSVRRRIDANLGIQLQGQRYCLAASHSLEGSS